MAAVNKYALLAAVPVILQFQANRMAVMVRPGLTQLYHGEKGDQRAKPVARLLLRLMGLAAATAFIGIWFINRSFVPLWVGPEYYAGDLANLLLAIMIALIIWHFCFKVLLEVRFQYRRRALVFFGEGMVTVVLSLVLAPVWGIPGVLIACIAAELAIVMPFALIPNLRWLAAPGNPLPLFFSVTCVPALMIVTAVLLFTFNVIPRTSSWPALIVSVTVVGIVAGAVGIAWLGRDLSRHMPWRKPNR
jgi:O-antigen/teichoic acid export membrane protein